MASSKINSDCGCGGKVKNPKNSPKVVKKIIRKKI